MGVLEEAFDRADATAPTIATCHALDRLERRLAASKDEAVGPLLQGLQQLSGPLMAKSVEDTAFYRFHRLLALNEVGGEPDSPGCRPKRFIAGPRGGSSTGRTRCWRRRRTTRSGARMRGHALPVLSEVPEDWEAAVGAGATERLAAADPSGGRIRPLPVTGGSVAAGTARRRRPGLADSARLAWKAG